MNTMISPNHSLDARCRLRRSALPRVSTRCCVSARTPSALPQHARSPLTSKTGRVSLNPGRHDAHTPVQRPNFGGQARAGVVARASLTLSFPDVLPLQGPWGVWAGLVFAGAFGIWSERTRLGRELSGALVSTLVGMALANIGVLPPGAPELHVVYKYLLPLAIPMLLFSANLRRILSETGRLLGAFLLGSAATVAGSAVAMMAFPLGRYLGDEGWKVASALTARHIGGAVNYMAVSETLSISPSTFGAGLAADDLILTLYFVAIYTLAKAVPPDAGQAAADAAAGGAHNEGVGGKTITVSEGLAALSVSALVCYTAVWMARSWGASGQAITFITGLTVALATLLPGRLAPLVPSAEGIAQILMQIFYATIGASANVGLVVKTAPVLFLFSLLALAAHLAILLGVGRLLGFSRRELLIASNANIGGPSTVAGMAAAKGWRSSIVPGILTSTLGYAIGTFIGIGLGYNFLSKIG